VEVLLIFGIDIFTRRNFAYKISMKILLKAIQIFDPRSPHHKKKKNVLIENGILAEIGDTNYRSDLVIQRKDLKVSPGWFDMRSDFCDPGYEHKEDLISGRNVAAAGGFTEVMILPNTHPVIQSKNEVSYVISGNQSHLVQIHPMGAVTDQTNGEELTEMIDLHTAGAKAFSDGKNPIWHTDILLKSLLYLQKFNGLLINRPEDTMLTRLGSMNEGLNSTILGLRGMPRLGEELMIERDIRILDYAGGKIHFSNISTEEAVKSIRRAKKKGMKITCDVAAHHLMLEDGALIDFDTNYKVNPPLREARDMKAIRKGLDDGTIDAIVSSHTPQDEESKKLEFDFAEFGMLGLQTVFPIMNSIDPKLLWLDKIISAPRNILGLPVPEIIKGAPANLTLFDPELKWTFDGRENKSKSMNSPFLGQKFKGKALGVFNNNKYALDPMLDELVNG
jgi:dihydroorotase